MLPFRYITAWLGVSILALELAVGGTQVDKVSDHFEDDQPVLGQLGLAPWTIEFQVSVEEFAALEPLPAPGFPGPGGPPPGGAGQGLPAPPADGPDRESVANLFGTRFPWVSGHVLIRYPEATDDPWEEVFETVHLPCRLRYDGDFTYMFSAISPKRPLFFQLDEPQSKGSIPLDGSSFRLHTMLFDPTLLRERAAVHIFSALQVPTPRIGHAKVYWKIGDSEPRFVGLYNLREVIAEKFLERHRIPAQALRMQINGLSSWQYLGDEWSAYAPLFRAHRPVTAVEQQRIIALAKLIGTASDADFAAQIGDFVEVDTLLRYLAAQSMAGNVTGFSTLGVNDFVCLDAESGRFTFVANEMETAMGGAALSGSAQQLGDLSLLRPFAGTCPMVERLFSDETIKQRYFDLLRESLESTFSESRNQMMVEAIAKASDAARAQESEAADVRNREIAAAGGLAFGGPPGGLPGGPPPLDVAAFLALRRASIMRQLAGEEGYTPSLPNQGGFGRRAAPSEAIADQEFRESVVVPEGFEATLFARSPEVNYPVAIAAEPSGAIYVGIDEQGSLGTSPGGGRVVRCQDVNGDGIMDHLTVFCRVDHVRGVAYRDGQVWVSHPPYLSVFRDLDGDGIADEQQVLVSGLTTEMVDTRGGDHTTNCVRFGIDGWLYIGDGDYGIPGAVGVDGSTVTLRGGGILRVRPDGTELELFASGLRNPFDIAIDPYLNLFTRDNTNDGGGWDTRVSQLHASAEYGYPRLFANFSDEIMPTLASFGGGGGTGGLYVEDPAWPSTFNRLLLTGDWGRSAVFHHTLRPEGPTFQIDQSTFVSVPRATGMDLDAEGNLYIASWWSGEASVYVGPHVGFVTRVAPTNRPPRSFPQLAERSLAELVDLLRAPQVVIRFHTQGELMKRIMDTEVQQALENVIADASFPLAGRVAAVFAMKQGLGQASHPFLLECLTDPSIREFAIRALADRRTQLTGLSIDDLTPYLQDEDPRVVVQAIIALGRLGDPLAAQWILPLAELGAESRPDPAQPNPDLVIPHLAVQSVVQLQAAEQCLSALEFEHWRAALRAMRQMHHSVTVHGLIDRLATERDLERRTEMLATLVRLYYQESPYDGSWWGIRPDTTGPYYDPMKWHESERIEHVVKQSLETADQETLARLVAELKRHQINWDGWTSLADMEPAQHDPIEIQPIDPNNPRQIGNLTYAEVLVQTLAKVETGDRVAGAELYKSRSCHACHTSAAGQQPVGPHLADIGQRYKAEELIESIVKPSEKIAQGYETQIFLLSSGEVVTGFVISETGSQIWLRDSRGITHKISRDEIDERSRQAISAMPEGLVGSMEPSELADLIAYLQSL